MRSTDFCFPLFRLRALAPRSFPASLRGLRPAPSRRACTLNDGDWGTRRFKTPDPLQRVAPGFCAAFSSAHSRDYRASDTPVARPWLALRLREARVRRVSRDRDMQAVREEPPATTIRDAFHRQPPAPCAGRTHSRERSREVFRFDEGASVSSPVAACLRTLELRARRPSLNASRSGEMESVRFSAPATVCRLLQQHQRRASTTSSVRSSLASTGGPSFEEEPESTRWPPLSVRIFRHARCATAPLLPKGGGQRATPHPRCRLLDSTSLPEGGAPKVTAPRDAACEAAPRVHRRLRRGWVRQ